MPLLSSEKTPNYILYMKYWESYPKYYFIQKINVDLPKLASDNKYKTYIYNILTVYLNWEAIIKLEPR